MLALVDDISMAVFFTLFSDPIFSTSLSSLLINTRFVRRVPEDSSRSSDGLVVVCDMAQRASYNNAIVKSGWGNRYNFQHSYGLGTNAEGIAEGNAILDSFRQSDEWHSRYCSGSPRSSAEQSHSSSSRSRSASQNYSVGQRSAQSHSYIASRQHQQSHSYISRTVSSNVSYHPQSRDTFATYRDNPQYHRSSPSESSDYSRYNHTIARDFDNLVDYFSTIDLHGPVHDELPRYDPGHNWTVGAQSEADDTHVGYSGFASATIEDGDVNYNDPGDYNFQGYDGHADSGNYDYSGSTEEGGHNGYQGGGEEDDGAGYDGDGYEDDGNDYGADDDDYEDYY